MLAGELTLPGSTSSVPAARHFAEQLLASWGLEDLSWSAALAVSELAANCALHARTEFTVRVVWEAAGAIRIEVSDGSARRPVERAFSSDATTGRGLRMLSEIAADWGVTMAGLGKTVWLRLDLRDTRIQLVDTDEVDIDTLLAAFGEDDTPAASPRFVPSDLGVTAGLPLPRCGHGG